MGIEIREKSNKMYGTGKNNFMNLSETREMSIITS